MSITADSPIITSTPHGTPEQCSKFMLSRPHGEYTERDISTVIVPAYFEVCAAVGADPVLLIAQMIHETGNLTSWWSQRPRRNPAGIGVTGQKKPEKPATGAWEWDEQAQLWKEGVAFATWKDDSVHAHVGRLIAYALADSQANAAQRSLIAKALGYRPLPSKLRGVAPILRGLNGRWAVPGTTYADSLAKTANAILSI